METAPLKSFATWARTALIREVAARIAVVLAPASPERVEQPSAIAALEKAVRAAGSGDAGRAAVADKVAYTWFNRIIALRFMDANGYTGIGVVSPERSREGGQPEVLAEAKRGNIDITVVTNKRSVETITSLLNGTRRSDDPQGEAYALLLAEYCRRWNRSMRFMFEREGDYTELLIPANLLADDSVLTRAVSVLTDEVCQDVEVIGWLYQFYISERKDEVFAGFKKNKKAGAAEIPAATQLFTPHWIVRYLVENSLGRLWLLNRPSSRLAEQMDYYIAPVDEETDYLKVSSPEELKIIDPACGSGHMLTYAFDLLYAIYEEEGYAPSDIPGLILAKNLYGTEIDLRAGVLAAFALTMKARARQRTFFNKKVEPNICVLEPISFTPGELDTLVARGSDRADEEAFWNHFQNADTFGSLIRPRDELIGPLRQHLDNHHPDGDIIGNELHGRARRVITQAIYLSPRYHVMVANPPYMGSGSMEPMLAEFAEATYPDTKSDLFAMFIERCLELGTSGALVGMITMQSWLFLITYDALRVAILKGRRVVQVVQLGARAFDTIGGEVVSTAAFILQDVNGADRRAVFVDLTDLRDESAKLNQLRAAATDSAAPHRREVVAERFLRLPRAPFAHAIKNFEIFDGPRLSGSWRSGGRLKTHDGSRFIRFWWEVSKTSDRWLTLIKGGDFRPFFGNREFVVDWSDPAVRFYRARGGLYPEENRGSVGICWTKITGRLSFRLKSADEEFDSASPTLLPSNPNDVFSTLAYLNSGEIRSLLGLLNPTINTQVSNVLDLPAPAWDVDQKEQLSRLGKAMTIHAKSAWRELETSDGFEQSAWRFTDATSLRKVVTAYLDEAQSRHYKQLELAKEIDTCVNQLLQTGLRKVSSDELAAESRSVAELALDLLSYSVGCMFGRYSLDKPGLILANQDDTLEEYLGRIPNPSFMPDKDNVIPIVDGDWFEDDIVARFREFLRVAFGERHFEDNLQFVTESLGVKDLRDYFVKSFYRDHVQRYKKRPIYWLFSSPKGSFNALIYMHRYTPSAVSTVLNEYLREFKAKLDAGRQHQERLAAGSGTPRQQAAAQKEADRLRKVLLELDEYEHDVLYPLATQQVQIDLDDGVKANYPKFGAALKKIPGLQASDE
jgi:hypothetical protein